MSRYEQYGFEKQETHSAVRVGMIKEVTGQIYTLDGYNLVASINLNDLEFIQSVDRFILRDRQGKVVANTDIYDMDGWMIKDYGDGTEEHVFSINKKNVYCKMLVKGYDVITVA